MVQRLRLGAWPLAVLAIIFAAYFRHFGSYAIPSAALLLGLAAWLWQDPSQRPLLLGLLGSLVAAAWTIWRVSEPWAFSQRMTTQKVIPTDTLRLLPAVFAVGASLQLAWLAYLWQRYPSLRPRDSA